MRRSPRNPISPMNGSPAGRSLRVSGHSSAPSAPASSGAAALDADGPVPCLADLICAVETNRGDGPSESRSQMPTGSGG